ncbi:MAG: mechanosensitive ion channel family protein, partial [Psychrobium sp.]
MEMIQQWYNEYSPMLVNYVIAFATAIIIYWVGGKIARVISNAFGKTLAKRDLDSIVVNFLKNIVYGVLMTGVIIAALGQVGIQTASFIAVLGAAGLAIGLALQGSLSNFASGVLIIVFRPFKSGDFIEAGGVSGIVEEIKLFSTYIRSGDNKQIILPNSSVTGGAITNYSTKPTRRIDLVIGVSYDADIKHAKKVLEEIVNGH